MFVLFSFPFKTYTCVGATHFEVEFDKRCETQGLWVVRLCFWL